MRINGYMGVELDDVELTKRVKAILLAMYGDVDVSSVSVMPLLMVELAEKDNWGDTKLAFINTEGVGSIPNDYNRAEVYYFSNAYGMMNVIEVGRQVLEGMATEQTHDLAEWVRTFGARLDSNVSLWQRKMPKPATQLA
jgi:hypothetical protein